MTKKYYDIDGNEIVMGRVYQRAVHPGAGLIRTFKSDTVHAYPTREYRPHKFTYHHKIELNQPKPHLVDGRYHFQRGVIDPTGKLTAFVIDLDGTVMCGKQRLDLIPPKELQRDPRAWDAFNMACDKDTPLRDTLAMVDAMYHAGHIPLFVTGRNDVAEDRSHTWLENHLDWYERGKFVFEMREVNDCGFPVDVKVHKIEKLAEKYDILFAIDDDPKICSALRQKGISCWQVRNWQESEQ